MLTWWLTSTQWRGGIFTYFLVTQEWGRGMPSVTIYTCGDCFSVKVVDQRRCGASVMRGLSIWNQSDENKVLRGNNQDNADFFKYKQTREYCSHHPWILRAKLLSSVEDMNMNPCQPRKRFYTLIVLISIKRKKYCCRSWKNFFGSPDLNYCLLICILLQMHVYVVQLWLNFHKNMSHGFSAKIRKMSQLIDNFIK